MTERLKAPFVWFGGKSAVAPLVWQRLGDCDNVIEPFCGSAAFLLARPHQPKVETLNDADCMVANFWRATSRDPEAVAVYADQPVNECDLHAIHRSLVIGPDAEAFRRGMRTDPDYFDPKVAGRWCAGLCMWIGSGWCDAHQLERHQNATPDLAAPWNSGTGMGIPQTGPALHQQVPDISPGVGVHAGLSRKIPHMDASPGVHASPGSVEGDLTAKRLALGGADNHKLGVGVHAWGEQHPLLAQGRPQLADAYDIGRGVHASGPGERRPRISGPGQGTKYGDGVHAKGDAPWDGSTGTCAARRAWLVDWFSRLRDRLRLVRVCCGHWSRVCGSPSVLTRLGLTGVFLDPPYPSRQKGKQSRSSKLYATDGTASDLDKLRDEVLAWCLGHGDNRLIRVALACYERDGYETLVADHGWSVVEWESQGGYGNRSGEKGKKQRKRERLLFSPHCLREPQRNLFDTLLAES
jgi:hypothetical protein